MFSFMRKQNMSQIRARNIGLLTNYFQTFLNFDFLGSRRWEVRRRGYGATGAAATAAQFGVCADGHALLPGSSPKYGTS